MDHYSCDEMTTHSSARTSDRPSTTNPPTTTLLLTETYLNNTHNHSNGRILQFIQFGRHGEKFGSLVGVRYPELPYQCIYIYQRILVSLFGVRVGTTGRKSTPNTTATNTKGNGSMQLHWMHYALPKGAAGWSWRQVPGTRVQEKLDWRTGIEQDILFGLSVAPPRM